MCVCVCCDVAYVAADTRVCVVFGVLHACWVCMRVLCMRVLYVLCYACVVV